VLIFYEPTSVGGGYGPVEFANRFILNACGQTDTSKYIVLYKKLSVIVLCIAPRM
jgi:hypothetical protein